MNTTHMKQFGVISFIAGVAMIGLAFWLPTAWAARGGAPQRSGGGGAHVGGGGGAHANVGHAPTFSQPHISASRAPAYRAPEVHNTPKISRPDIARPNLSRPEIATRPEISRPEVSRPAISRPSFETRPEFAQRPAIEGRPDVVGRPGFENNLQNRYDFFGRPGIGGHEGVAVRPSYVSHPDLIRHPGATVGVGVGAGRIGAVAGGRDPLLGSWYHGNWHRDWTYGRNGWYGRPAWWWGNNWWGAGYLPGYAAWQIPWTWGYWSYYNPYYTGPLTFGATTVNYSQPIVLAQPPAGVDQTSAEDQATAFFDSARDAFTHGDYQQALTQVDNAIALLPNDSVLHEFRGLALFALGDYRQAAASIYAALSVGPGWDWTTLSSFYPDTDVYTQQLRALEQYAGAHPGEPDARFLLAYEYLTCGYTDQAVAQLQDVVRLNPKDQLSAQLLASLTNPQSASPGAPGGAVAGEPVPPNQVPIVEGPPATSTPLTTSALAGRWVATRPDGGQIVLNLGSDGKYDWNYTAGGQSQNFGGAFSLADNLLILKQGDTPAMVGQVTLVNNRQFNFKMPGDNPNDPGLTFTRG